MAPSEKGPPVKIHSRHPRARTANKIPFTSRTCPRKRSLFRRVPHRNVPDVRQGNLLVTDQTPLLFPARVLRRRPGRQTARQTSPLVGKQKSRSIIDRESIQISVHPAYTLVFARHPLPIPREEQAEFRAADAPFCTAAQEMTRRITFADHFDS